MPTSFLRTCAHKTRTQSLCVFACKSASTCGAAVESGYQTLARKHTVETEVKKSKFRATGWPVTSSEQALSLIAEAGDPSASHNCFAYKLGAEFRSSDDGEPGGTAGRPILSSIEGESLDFVCVLVTRYFGGTKLGAGGLVRAYGGAAREVLRAAEKKWVTPQQDLRIKVSFEHVGVVYQLLEAHGAERLDEEYAETGEAVMTLRVEKGAVQTLEAALLDATSGVVKPEEL